MWNNYFGYQYSHPWGNRLRMDEKEKRRLLIEQKKHGLPSRDWNLPVFVNAWEAVRSGVILLFFVMLELASVYVYMNDPQSRAKSAFIFFMGVGGMVWFVFRLRSYYPLIKECVDERKARRFIHGLHWTQVFCFGISAILSLTPFWGFLFSRQIIDHYEFFRISEYTANSDYNPEGWVMGVMTFIATYIFAFFFVFLFYNRLDSEESIKQRLTYLQYRAGKLNEAEIRRVSMIAKKREEIERRKLEIGDLELEIKKLEKEK